MKTKSIVEVYLRHCLRPNLRRFLARTADDHFFDSSSLVSKLLEACTKDDLLSDCGDVQSVDRLGAIAEEEYTALLAAEPVVVDVSCS